jgi:Ran GTPase-activating protein (RanGAP) involved in mRNA processing and transport
VLTGNSITTVAREELCGYVASPATIEHPIMEDMFALRSVPELYNKD